MCNSGIFEDKGMDDLKILKVAFSLLYRWVSHLPLLFEMKIS